ncbi:MAG: hypothetical protein Q8Q09_27020 [Deltaproteobacteria bacterium]|nr:hypothetical protein [Deltaproteobacteria bacterium]
MKTPVTLALLPRVTSTLLLSAMASCGAPPGEMGGPLPSAGPYLESTMTPTRSVVFTAYRPPTSAGETARCGVQALLFDPSAGNGRSRNMLAREGECVMYPPAVDLQIPLQNWVCAGALDVTVGSLNETIALCPSMRIGMVGAAGINAPFAGCEALMAGAAVSVRSGAEIDGDTLTDLTANTTLPGPVEITSPTALAVGPWPTMGDLDLRWRSANGTSALVTLEARDSGNPAPTIVCIPRTSGRVWVPSGLLTQANFRTREVRVTVSSYRDVTVQAEGGKDYRLSAGFASSVILQPNR